MSQQAQSADTTAAAPASVKRTPAQREKKRAQDRQSQRNVRNRTKQYIANLEAKVNELSSYEGLSHLIAANESLQAQNDNLITALRSIATLVEKVCDSAAASSKVAAEASARAAAEKKTVTERRQKFGSWTSPATSPEAHGNDDNDGVTSAFERVSFDGRHHTQRVHSVVVPTSPRSQEKQAELRHSSRQASTANTKNGTEHNLRTYSMHSGSMDSQAGHEPYLPPHMAFDDTWARPMAVSSGADSGMLWEASCLPTAPSATAHMMLLDRPMTSLPYEPTSSYSNSELSHSLVSQICAPTNVWDAKLFAFIRLHRSSRLIQTDKSTLEPTFPNVDILVYPNRPSAAADPITRFLADAINAWNFDIPERLGVFWLNYIFLKWAIAPTAANTRHLPDWLQPKPPQCDTSHPIYIDTIPWPEMRNKITFHYPLQDFQSWVPHFCGNVNVSWKQDPQHTYIPNFDGTLRLNPAFEVHVRSLHNWTLDAPFALAYPHLALENSLL